MRLQTAHAPFSEQACLDDVLAPQFIADIAQASVVVDPVTLMMTATLMVATQKLDSIQRTQQEMFECLRQRDEAALRGVLQALADIARDYRFNWSNETFSETRMRRRSKQESRQMPLQR